MSIRAYKIIEIKTAKEPTLNIGEHFAVLDRYIPSFMRQVNEDGTGIIEFSSAELNNALNEAQKEENDQDHQYIFRDLLNDLDAREYVQYYLF